MKAIIYLCLFELPTATAPVVVATASLLEALPFHASFDHGPDADFGQGDHHLFSAPSMKHPRTATPGLPTNGIVSIACGEGRIGISYTGMFDDLAFFNRSLTVTEVGKLFALPGGVATLHP